MVKCALCKSDQGFKSIIGAQETLRYAHTIVDDDTDEGSFTMQTARTHATVTTTTESFELCSTCGKKFKELCQKNKIDFTKEVHKEKIKLRSAPPPTAKQQNKEERKIEMRVLNIVKQYDPDLVKLIEKELTDNLEAAESKKKKHDLKT